MVVAAVVVLVKVGVKGAFTPVYKSTVLQPDIASALKCGGTDGGWMLCSSSR